jgi:NADPH:quinone reductase-like Zn-dependent oxidoreductase
MFMRNRISKIFAAWFLMTTASAVFAIPATTRQVVLEKTDAGYRWKIIEAVIPTIGDHQVLVHVRAVALNRGDLDMLDDDPKTDHTGKIPASDAAGEVMAVGKLVKGFSKGQRVTNTYFLNWVDGPFSDKRLEQAHGWTANGVLAEYLVLDDTSVAPMAKGLSFEEASTLPTAGLTAWNAINAHQQVDQDSVVLVQGTGGLSTFALQFAVAKGARVIVTSSSDDKLQRSKSLGARDGINYKTEPDWSQRALALTNGHGADLVVDVGGKSTLDQSVKSLADAGTVAIIGGLTGYGGSISAWGLLKKSARAQSVFVGSRADLMRMNRFIEQHRLHPVIDRVYPLEEFDIALQHLRSGQFVGKIVLRL